MNKVKAIFRNSVSVKLIKLILIFVYLAKVFLARVKEGLIYRKNTIDTDNLKRCFLKYIPIIIAMLGFLGFTWRELLPTLLSYANSAIATFERIPALNRILLIVFFSLFSILMVLKLLISKKRLFMIATRRISDQIEESRRATEHNDEAEKLIRLIDRGKGNENAYSFLTNLWMSYINGNPALSMISLPKYGNRPIVSVNIQHLPVSLDQPEEQLNSIIKVLSESLYKDYSGKEKEQDYVTYYHKKLNLREPLCRYLSRYKGPKETDVGFKNDYTGYNACLRSMNFFEGRLVLPIECTMELYGNAMDSSDTLINELYLQFAFDKFSTNIPPEIILKLLPWRNSLHHRYKNPTEILTQVKGRAAAFGLSALTVFNRDGMYVAARGLRATKVGTFPNVHHVIPSGMTNINLHDVDSNKYLIRDSFLNIQLLIEKEFLEEVFDKEWARTLRISGDSCWPTVVKSCIKEQLYGIDDKYNTKIYFTGIVFDLMNYRPEICALILIKDKIWWEDHNPYKSPSGFPWQLSNEWVDAPGIDVNDETDVMPPIHSVPAGIAAYHLGVQKARTLV